MALNPRLLAAGAVAVVAVGVIANPMDEGYEAQLVMPSAAELPKGSPVWIKGRPVGRVADVAANGGKAVVTVAIDEDQAPLHEGTRARIEWVSAVGERVLTLYPGADNAAEIADGSLVEVPTAQIEVDQLLQTLDEPTRAKLRPLIEGARATLEGHEADARETLAAAGPTARSLSKVLAAVGADGPAIRSLVTDLSQVTAAAGKHQAQLSSTVRHLTATTEAVAAEQQALSRTLAELPTTLATARKTLATVPDASDSTVEMLHDLRPAASRLPSVSANLAPALVDLRPTVAELRPLLEAAVPLLARTPGLLDSVHAVLPTVDDLLDGLAPAISFLRPYTPDGIGGLQNWGQAFAPYDGAGHTWAGLLAPGVNAVNESVVVPPTSRKPNRTPAPGSAERQPWTDATGSEIR